MSAAVRLRQSTSTSVAGRRRFLGKRAPECYSGLVALGVPEDSLQSFPEAFRVGMAARADELLDHGENDPSHWEAPFGTGLVRIGLSVFSDSEAHGGVAP